MYIDASVLIARYIQESYSERIEQRFAERADLVCSDLAELETLSAFSRMVRTGVVDFSEARLAAAVFDTHLAAGVYLRLHIEPEHFRWARSAIARFDLPLKAPDALHLAAAQRDGLTLVTADRQLARNAEALGVAVHLIAP